MMSANTECGEQACVLLVNQHYPDAQLIEYPNAGFKVVAEGLQDYYCHQTPLEAWRTAAAIVNRRVRANDER